MRRICLWIFPFAVLFAAGCSNESGNRTQETDTATAVTEKDPEGRELESIQTSFPELFRNFSSQDPSFSVDSFYLSGTESMSMEPAQLEEERIEPFRPFLIFNYDSSKAIDIYSYNYFPVEKSGKIVFEEAGPDTEAALIDFKNKTRQRLIFLGTAGTIQAAKWLNHTEILVAGGELIGGKIKPIIWKISPPQIETFQYTDTLNWSGQSFPKMLPHR